MWELTKNSLIISTNIKPLTHLTNFVKKMAALVLPSIMGNFGPKGIVDII